MKKLLLTAAFAIMSFAAFAQDAPDASTWKVGDDVSEAVNFGNLSFELRKRSNGLLASRLYEG